MNPTLPDLTDVERAEIREALTRDGITATRGAFSRDWVAQLDEDVMAAFADAQTRENGAIGRGPNRWYVEVHPQALRGFVDLVEHPWVRGTCDAVLGEGWTIVEIGFDIPFPGARNQPWHRDFAAPDETRLRGRLSSLAFNLTTVDTEPDMGPFEIAPGTQFDDGSGFEHGMFPPRESWPRYEALAVRKYPQMGDMSARSALTVHRGTTNFSQRPRPVLVLGVIGSEAVSSEHHGPVVTRDYWQQLPERVRCHLRCPVVDELTPITQTHFIEGLVMAAAATDRPAQV